MPASFIKTFTSDSFRATYVQPETVVPTLLKTDAGKFFIMPLEAMTRLMKLPVPPTRIGNHTLLFLTEGKATMNIGSDRFTITQHECLVVPAGQVFSFADVEPNQGFICNVHPDFIVGKFGTVELLNGFDFLRVWGNPIIRPTTETAGYITWIFQRLLLDYAEQGVTNPGIIQSYFIALLCELNTAYVSPSAGVPSRALDLTNQFKELLISQVRTHHLVSDYAAMLAITPNHLTKSVNAVTGKSPTKWIDEAIVLEAKMLLHQTRLPVGEVAAEVGILDASYFSRLFKKYEGMSPLAFRQLIETF